MSAIKSRAAFLAILLATTTMASLFALPVAAADNGWVRFQDANEKNYTATTEIVGYGATTLIKVHDKDLTEPTVKVVVTSTSDTTGEEITLQRLERGNTAVYTGYVGYEATRVAGNGEVRVADDDKVSVVYIDNSDSGGNAAARQDILTWVSGADGRIVLDSAAYFGSLAKVEVDVLDADIPATKTTFQVKASSKLADDKVTLTLSQTADGLYEGTFEVEVDTDVATEKLAVKDGDTITVTYAESGYDLKGHDETPEATASWEQSFDGRVQFTNKAYTLVRSDSKTACTSCPSIFGTEDGTTVDKAGAWIRVEDRDLQATGTLTVNVRSTNTANVDVDPTGVNIELKETGTATGEFHGFVGFLKGSPSTGKQLRVTDGATVDVRYLDSNDGTGEEVLRTASSIWRDTVLEFRTTSAGSTKATTYDATGNSAAGYIYLKDTASSGAGPLKVRLMSTPDPAGVSVTLTESGSTGEFRGSFSFSATGSLPTGAGAGGLAETWAEKGDKLSLVYQSDARRAADVGIVEVKDAVSISNPTKARPTVSPVPTLKMVTGSTSSTAITGVSGTSTIHVLATDNVTGSFDAPVTIVAGSTSNPTNWTAAGMLAAGNGFSKSVAESTTKDTYRTTFTFGTTGTNVVAKHGDHVCVAMLVANKTGVNSQVYSHCVPFTTTQAPVTAAIQFRDDAFQGTTVTDTGAFRGITKAYVFVRDADLTADTKSTQEEVEVRITSESDTTGIKIKLKERYGRQLMPADGVLYGGSPSGVDDRGFIGEFTFTTEASSGSALKVNHRDTISVFYDDKRDATGVAKTVVAQTKWERTYDGTVSIDRNLVRATTNPGDAANEVTITVVDKDRDTSVTRETFSVNVENSTGTSISVTLTETTATSGIFQGKFKFHRAEWGGTAGSNLPVRDVEDFTVIYNEQYNRAGKAVKHEVVGTWFDVNAARVTWNNSTYTTTGAIATITLEDPDRDATTTIGTDNFYAWVTSDTDGAGRWILFEEASAKSGGLFFGTVGFTGSRVGTAQTNKIAVSDGDRITVHYFDEERNGDNVRNNPSGEGRGRTVHAEWETAANQPPTVTVKIGNNAANTDVEGLQKNTTLQFFVTATDSDGTIANWKLSFGDDTANVTGTGNPPTAATTHKFAEDGIYTVRFEATDDDGAVSKAELRAFVGQGDSEAPGAPTAMKLVSAGTVSVTFEFTVPDGNGVAKDKQAISAYTVKHASAITTQAQYDAATTVSSANLKFTPVALAEPGAKQTVTVAGLTKDTAYTFAVVAKDAVGNAGAYATLTGAKTLAKDATPPAGTIAVTSSHAKDQTSTENTVRFNWNAIVDSESAVTYHFVLNKVASYTVSGQEPSSTDVKTTFNGQPDGTYYFHVAACSEGGCGATATYGPITIGTEAAGPETIDPVAITAANKQVGLEVTRSGSDNTVTWTIPTDTPQPVVGVQIWSSNSPWTLLVTLNAGDPAFEAGEYVHMGAPEGTKYQVTLFYGKEPGMGFAASSDDVPGFDELGEGSTVAASGMSGLIIGLIVAGAILLVALVVGLVLALRPKKDEDMEEEGMAWNASEETWDASSESTWDSQEYAEPGYEEASPEAESEFAPDSYEGYEAPEAYDAPEDVPEAPAYEAPPIAPVPEPATVDPHTHHLTCPSCNGKFTAYGPKPLVTECPSCGVRGILR